MELFLQLKETGISVTLKDLDELYEKEWNQRLDNKYGFMIDNLVILGKEASHFYDNPELLKEYQVGISKAIELVQTFRKYER